MNRSRLLHPLLPLAAALIISGCAPIVDNRGAYPTPESLAALKPGLHTRAQVAQLLGTPSTVGTFDDSTWYYINQRTEQVAFFAPETTEQKVVMIHFDKAGTVDKIEDRSLADGKEVQLVTRETPTAGHSMTIMEQLFGNIGRFSRGIPGTGSPSPSRGY